LKLNISDDLKLPLDFVTQTQAILAKKRVGKTYTAKVQAEELLKANQQIVAIDPTGAWWA
jgi:DNA helicase HerA-like ATPase